jgi:hypothetical protein
MSKLELKFRRLFKTFTALEAIEMGLKHKENFFEDREGIKGKSLWVDDEGKSYRIREVWNEYSKY